MMLMYVTVMSDIEGMCTVHLWPNPAATERNNNAIITPKTMPQRRFNVIMTLLLYHVTAGKARM